MIRILDSLKYELRKVSATLYTTIAVKKAHIFSFEAARKRPATLCRALRGRTVTRLLSKVH